MNRNMTDTPELITISRAVLHGSRRTPQGSTPLLRNEAPERINDEFIDIPAPVPSATHTDTEDVRILHVDDSAEITETAKVFLERVDEDFTVVGETSVVKALDLLGESEFDCIISDYEMPNTNGIEFLEIVREQYPDLPFILYTGKGSEEIASEAIAAGVTDYMQKQSSTEQYEVLANRVRNAVDRYHTQRRFWDALSWYQRLVEQDLAGVFIIQNQEFIYVNERFAAIFDYPQHELIGASPEFIASTPEDAAACMDVVTMDHERNETFQCEFIGKRSGGDEIPVEIHGGAIEYEGEGGCIGILWDRSD